MYMKVDDPFLDLNNLIHPKTGAEKVGTSRKGHPNILTRVLEIFQNGVER